MVETRRYLRCAGALKPLTTTSMKIVGATDDLDLGRQWLVWLPMAGRGVYSVDTEHLRFVARLGDFPVRDVNVQFVPEGLAAHFDELVLLGMDRQYSEDCAWHALADLLEDELRNDSGSEVEFSLEDYFAGPTPTP